MTRRIQHARVGLALHRLSEATDSDAPPLLLLHELGGSAQHWAGKASPWPGDSWALDFCGHGDSDWLRSALYYSELWAGDADTALSALGGQAVLVGAGSGAYVALLLAGSRPDSIPAAILAPGRGLVGGGAVPNFDNLIPEPPKAGDPARDRCDPRAVGVEDEVRPPDYAAAFAQCTRRLLLVEDGAARPPWWQACREAGAEHVDSGLADALARLSN